MLLDDLKKIKSTDEELRKFGITVGVFFGLVGGFLLWRGSGHYPVFFILSLILLVPAFLKPSLLKPVQKVWMGLALMIGWVMTRVILSILFYLVLTPISLLAKIFGRNFLDLKGKETKESYWIPRPETPYNKARYENQF